MASGSIYYKGKFIASFTMGEFVCSQCDGELEDFTFEFFSIRQLDSKYYLCLSKGSMKAEKRMQFVYFPLLETQVMETKLVELAYDLIKGNEL